MSGLRLALIPPRYGPGVVGGAESLIGDMAHGLAERGWDVEIITTCAKDHYTWANHYAPGVEHDGGVTIRRFPVVNDTSGQIRHDVEMMLAQGVHPGLPEQQLWMNDGLRVPELFHYLLDHSDDYDAIIPAPYMFWTSFVGGQVASDRTILMPCLHDEPYARMEIFEPLFNGVAGVWFLTEPEAELGNRLFDIPRQAVVGSGCAVPESYDTDGFCARNGITGRFILAGGRREGAKGWDAFMAGYTDAVRGGLELDLVTFGVGEVGAGDDIAGHVIDLGFISDDELSNAFAAADAYVQPSAMESFSRTIMESWLAGTLVVANSASDVVSWHCERSGAGLVYRDAFELVESLRFVEANPDLAASLAEPGRAYVLDHYTWPVTLDRMEAVLKQWL